MRTFVDNVKNFVRSVSHLWLKGRKSEKKGKCVSEKIGIGDTETSTTGEKGLTGRESTGAYGRDWLSGLVPIEEMFYE